MRAFKRPEAKHVDIKADSSCDGALVLGIFMNRLRIEFMATDITSPQVPHTTMERGENIVLTVDGINNCRDNHSS